MNGICATLAIIVSIIMLLKTRCCNSQQYRGNKQYYTELDRNYGGRRQDVLEGQFVNVEQQQQQQQQQQQDQNNDAVPVVITGEEYTYMFGEKRASI